MEWYCEHPDEKLTEENPPRCVYSYEAQAGARRLTDWYCNEWQYKSAMEYGSCYDSCPYGMYTYQPSMECVYICPPGYTGDSNTYSCMVDSGGGGDSGSCQNGQIMYDNMCIDWCPSGTFADYNTNMCVTQCPRGTFGDKNYKCVDRCREPYYGDLQERLCLDSCPEFTRPNDETRICESSLVYSCRDPEHVLEGTICSIYSGAQNRPCCGNGLCEAEKGETFYTCRSDCPGTNYATLSWTSRWDGLLTAPQGYGYDADWTDAYNKFDYCLGSSCSVQLQDCANNWVSDTNSICGSVYVNQDKDECINSVQSIYSFSISQAWNALSSAQNQNGCNGGVGGSTATTCGGNQCSDGITSCCSYHGNQVCANSDGSCPQEGIYCGTGYCNVGESCCSYHGNQVCANSDGSCPQEGNLCGTVYCNIGESCCSDNVCSVAGACPNSGGGGGGGGSCNNNGICDSWENADYCLSDCGCNNDGTCQSERGESISNCWMDCGCNSNAICEPGRGEAIGNCEDCSSNGGGNTGGGFDPCPGGYMGPNGCEYPQPGSHCASELEGSYWTGAECACPGSSRNLGNGRCEEGGGGGGGGDSTQCNGDSICQEGETQEGCPSDCPWGCNNNQICDDANGEDFNNCPYDCKDPSSGIQDFSTSVWTSTYNSGWTVQQGYGYWANWYSCLTDIETCWSNCGNDYNSCIIRFPECAVRTCYGYGGGIRTECVNTMSMISSNIAGNDQATFAYQGAQQKACGENNMVRRLNQKSHGHLRK